MQTSRLTLKHRCPSRARVQGTNYSQQKSNQCSYWSGEVSSHPSKVDVKSVVHLAVPVAVTAVTFILQADSAQNLLQVCVVSVR